MINFGDGNNSTAENIPAQREENNQERHSFLPTTITISNQNKAGFIPIIEGADSGFYFKLDADPLGFEQLFGISIAENPVLTKLLPPSELEKFQKIISGDLSNPQAFNTDNYIHFTIVTPGGMEKHIVTSALIVRNDTTGIDNWEMVLEMIFFDITEAIDPILEKFGSDDLTLIGSFIRDLRTQLSINSIIISQVSTLIDQAIDSISDSTVLAGTLKKLKNLNEREKQHQEKIIASLGFLQSLLNITERHVVFNPMIWIETFKTRNRSSEVVRTQSVDETISNFRLLGNESLLDLSIKELIGKLSQDQPQGFQINVSMEKTGDYLSIKLNGINAKSTLHLPHIAEYFQASSLIDEDQIESVEVMYIKKILKEYFKGDISITIKPVENDNLQLECVIKIPFVKEIVEG